MLFQTDTCLFRAAYPTGKHRKAVKRRAAFLCSTGISEAQLNQLKQLPLFIAPGTGGEECLRRCGM